MGDNSYLKAGRKSYLGVDLSGGHPISIDIAVSDPGQGEIGHDIGVKPLSQIVASRTVHLDEKGKIQCTTCHDPHSDRNYRSGVTPHFWVKQTVAEVCLACHEVR
jgi:predicted CXXCH cytochrome family protein